MGRALTTTTIKCSILHAGWRRYLIAVAVRQQVSDSLLLFT